MGRVSCFSDMNSPVKSVKDFNNSIDRITHLRLKKSKQSTYRLFKYKQSKKQNC